jgi:hypothetical protein
MERPPPKAIRCAETFTLFHGTSLPRVRWYPTGTNRTVWFALSPAGSLQEAVDGQKAVRAGLTPAATYMQVSAPLKTSLRDTTWVIVFYPCYGVDVMNAQYSPLMYWGNMCTGNNRRHSPLFRVFGLALLCSRRL